MQPAGNQPQLVQPQMVQPQLMVQPVPANPAGMTAQPGMMAQSLWVGMPPPKETASTWWGMYKPDEGRGKIGADGRFTRGSDPDDCGNCLFGFFCESCAHGEVMAWATGDENMNGQACVCYALQELLCAGVFSSCFVADARKKSEEKIWTFHQQRGGACARTCQRPAPTFLTFSAFPPRHQF